MRFWNLEFLKRCSRQCPFNWKRVFLYAKSRGRGKTFLTAGHFCRTPNYSTSQSLWLTFLWWPVTSHGNLNHRYTVLAIFGSISLLFLGLLAYLEHRLNVRAFLWNIPFKNCSLVLIQCIYCCISGFSFLCIFNISALTNSSLIVQIKSFFWKQTNLWISYAIFSRYSHT